MRERGYMAHHTGRCSIYPRTLTMMTRFLITYSGIWFYKWLNSHHILMVKSINNTRFIKRLREQNLFTAKHWKSKGEIILICYILHFTCYGSSTILYKYYTYYTYILVPMTILYIYKPLLCTEMKTLKAFISFLFAH